MTALPDPFGCAACGDAQHHHGDQWHPAVGLHQWQRPSDAQILARMLNRRHATLEARALHTVAPHRYHTQAHYGADGDPICVDDGQPDCPRLWRHISRLEDRRCPHTRTPPHPVQHPF